jgi:predicted trehalose synthase
MASRTPPSDVLAAWVAGQRWYATKTRRVEAVAVEDDVPVDAGALAIARAVLDGGAEDRYALPLLPGDGVVDALDDARFCRALLELIARGGVARGERGELRGVPAPAMPRALPDELPVRRLGGEQSNTSIGYGDVLILKHFRRLAPGRNPEEEVTRFLTERAHFPHTPALAGHLEYRRGGEATVIAVVQAMISGARDGWQWMLEVLDDRARRPQALAVLERLGAATAALHRALASCADDPAFAPEAITAADLDAWERDVTAQLAAARAACGDAAGVEPRAIARGLAGLADRTKIRHHGDFHLGQTLYREATGDVFIIDFEGEPLRSLDERRRKHTPLRDVAGMLRSIDYAAVTAGAGASWTEAWKRDGARAFTDAYRDGTRGAAFVPATDADFARAVAVFVVEKAAYEIVYEANHRPAWVDIPRRGLLSAAEALGSAAAAGEA